MKRTLTKLFLAASKMMEEYTSEKCCCSIREAEEFNPALEKAASKLYGVLWEVGHEKAPLDRR